MHKTRTGPTEAQTRQNPDMEGKGGHELPTPSQRAMAIDSCSEKKSLFSLKVWHQAGSTCSDGWPHSQEAMSSINCT